MLSFAAESAQQSENLVEHKKKSSEGHWLKETFETFKETVETIKEETVETIKETLETCKNKAILWAKDEIFIRLQKKLLEANYSITNVNIRFVYLCFFLSICKFFSCIKSFYKTCK